jgi:uncharacterized Rmd1/YagE family protein
MEGRSSPLASPLERPAASEGLLARAVMLGDRIETSGLEPREPLSATPLAFRLGDDGFVAVFRYGVVVLAGLDPIREDEALRGLQGRVQGPISPREEETARIQPAAGPEDRIDPDGVVRVAQLTPERLLVIADALAKSVGLAHAERQVDDVFDAIEPLARQLAAEGRVAAGRRAMLRMIGSALQVQHRVSRRVAAGERLDILWDRPDLDRLYSRLEDEYELVERREALDRKLALIGETAARFTDLIDTERSLRLELMVAILIVVEILITGAQIAAGALRH